MVAGVPSAKSSTGIKRVTRTVHLIPKPFTTVKVSMADNLPALVNAGSTFRIVTLTGNHLAGVSGVFPKGMDSQPIFTNYGPGNETTVWQFLVSIRSARLTSSAVVGSNQGGCRR